MTQSLRVGNLLPVSSLSCLPANSDWFVFVTASFSGSPPSLDVSFSHSFISPNTGLDRNYTPSPLSWAKQVLPTAWEVGLSFHSNASSPFLRLC